MSEASSPSHSQVEQLFRWGIPILIAALFILSFSSLGDRHADFSVIYLVVAAVLASFSSLRLGLTGAALLSFYILCFPATLRFSATASLTQKLMVGLSIWSIVLLMSRLRYEVDRSRQQTATLVPGSAGEPLLHSLIEGTPDLVAVLDSDLRLTAFNRAYQAKFEACFGHRIELGMSLLEALPDRAERQAGLELWQRALRGESFTVVQPFAGQARSPEAYPQTNYETTYTALRDRQGRVIGASHFARAVRDRQPATEIDRLSQELERLQHSNRLPAAEVTEFRAQQQRSLLEALNSKQLLLEAVLQQMPAGILVAEAPTGKVVLMNQQVRQILGEAYSPPAEIAAYLTDYQAFKQDGQPYSRSELPLARALLQGEVIINEEITVVQPDRSSITVLVSASPIQAETGQIVAAVITFYDITDRKQAQAALEHSEAKLRRLVEANIFGVAIGAADGTFLYANDALLHMIGYRREELLSGNITWMDLTPAEHMGLDEQASIELRQRGVITPFQKEYIHKDGHRVPILLGAALLNALDTEPEQNICFYMDLTELKQTEMALRQSEARYMALVQNVPGVIYQLKLSPSNPEGDFLYVSPGCFDLYEIDSETIRQNAGLTWQAIHPDDREAFTQSLLWDANTGDRWQHEWRIVTPSGKVKWLQAMARAERQGSAVFWDGLLVDVTLRKQAEAALRESERRERAARQDAETANRIKDEFLAVLSHELRSPLNPILGWARLLRSGRFDAEATDRALEVIERNAKLQSQLIEDLLDVSRILRGKLSLEIAPVNLATTIEAALETVRLAAEAKSIDLRFAILGRDSASPDGSPDDSPDGSPDASPDEQSPDSALSSAHPSAFQVLGDFNRLQQVMWNLLSNAIKFTPEGGRVEVQLAAVDRPPAWVAAEPMPPSNEQEIQRQSQLTRYAQITVTDTGRGIAPEFLPYVFEYFRQADGSTTRKFGGLGLGLAIVRQVVELHGGSVWAESQGQGQGATFTVRLPLQTALPQVETAASPNPQINELSGLQILVVDDDADIRELIATILESYGAGVQMAASAAEALHLLNQFVPDVLVSDIGMPGVDGYSLIQQIRLTLHNPVPAIALTAYAGELDQQQAIAVGFQLHITKPVEPEVLVQAVAQLGHPSPANPRPNPEGS